MKLPDINFRIYAIRNEILRMFKRKKFINCYESLKHFNNLLPNKYRVVISDIEYEKVTKIKTFFICNECKLQINYKEIKIKNKIWVCSKCQNENKLSDTVVAEILIKKTVYCGVIPKPPKRKEKDKKNYNRKYIQWCQNFLAELEEKAIEYRNDYRENKDDQSWV